jgi:glycosyltransferase involved in cell wall biosynthesis
MKFSVLLPTKNRLTYLKYAISSVVKQDYDEWELIISDNESLENVEEYVTSLKEPRIKYSRTKKDLSVTENWNCCVEQCSGDYVIMLGDDDILLKKYFQITKKLVEDFQPDLIYSNAFLFAYPNVIPGHPKGVFQPFGSLCGMPKQEEPFWLDRSCRIGMVQKMMRFEPTFATNMQHALIHLSLIKKIKSEGRFFYSPYPDFYAMCALFIESERTLIYPRELVVIGITPKSHGFYYYNEKEKEGAGFLKTEDELSNVPTLRPILLPGSGSMLSYWLAAMELLKLNFDLEKNNLSLDYQVYRKAQFYQVMGNYLSDRVKFLTEYKELMKRLTLSEKIFFRCSYFKGFLRKILPKPFKRAIKRMLQAFKKQQDLNETPIAIGNPLIRPKGWEWDNPFSHAMEIFEKVTPQDNLGPK